MARNVILSKRFCAIVGTTFEFAPCCIMEYFESNVEVIRSQVKANNIYDTYELGKPHCRVRWVSVYHSLLFQVSFLRAFRKSLYPPAFGLLFLKNIYHVYVVRRPAPLNTSTCASLSFNLHSHL